MKIELNPKDSFQIEYDEIYRQHLTALENLAQARSLVRSCETDCHFYEVKMKYLEQKIGIERA
jgi:hypothetical protein